MQHLKTGLAAILMLLLLSVALPTPIQASGPFLEQSTDEYHYLRGIVDSVDLDDMQVYVRALKGKGILLEITPETIVEGVRGLEELERRQEVKVWYSIEKRGNIAAKLQKLMELGC